MSQVRSHKENSPELFFRDLLESAPDAMVIVDSSGRILIVNSQAERMFGYLRDEMYGEQIEMLLPAEIRTRHSKQRAGYAANPHVRPMGRGLELDGRRKDGSKFSVEVSLSPVRTQSATYFSSVIRDVTERKQMETELIEARRAAEHANKANTAFLAAASHDLRQPVQALSLLNGALKRSVSEQKALDMLASQEKSLVTMTNLLNSLLDISRLDAGAIEPRPELFSMQSLFDRVATDFNRQAAQKGLKFDVVPSDLRLEADPNLLAEIIQNLVSNAIRYTDEGGVRLFCEQLDDAVCVCVEDTGIGIAEGDQQDIFEAFQQINVPGKKSEGFGLGLAIVKRLSDLLGTRMQVRSEPGKGSTFSVWLPSHSGEIQGAQELDPEPPVGEAAISGSVLLIEDNQAVGEALRILIEAEGIDVALAATAGDALELARSRQTADVIVSDFHLQDDSTGAEAISSLRELYAANTPALIITGDTSIVVDSVRGLDNCLLIRKPVNPDQLLADLRTAIETGMVPASIVNDEGAA